MPREEPGSRTSARGRTALLASSHRQDALWEVGNDALPPSWQQFELFDGTPQYQDDMLIMPSLNQGCD
ncbi:hypothetical protein BDR05DRAFT_800044 [Suillus weaverae]|nr:hypothetical protein BDR05DRAFT_800044 [Suillus weaverae]